MGHKYGRKGQGLVPLKASKFLCAYKHCATYSFYLALSPATSGHKAFAVGNFFTIVSHFTIVLLLLLLSFLRIYLEHLSKLAEVKTIGFKQISPKCDPESPNPGEQKLEVPHIFHHS